MERITMNRKNQVRYAHFDWDVFRIAEVRDG